MTFESQFSSSTIWVLGIRLRGRCLQPLSHHTISLAILGILWILISCLVFSLICIAWISINVCIGRVWVLLKEQERGSTFKECWRICLMWPWRGDFWEEERAGPTDAEMAQFACKHEDLSLIPKTYVWKTENSNKNPNVEMQVCIIGSGKEKIGRSWESWARQCSLVVEFQVPERLCLKNQHWMVPEEDATGCHLASISPCTHTHSCTPLHTHTHTYPHMNTHKTKCI